MRETYLQIYERKNEGIFFHKQEENGVVPNFYIFFKRNNIDYKKGIVSSCIELMLKSLNIEIDIQKKFSGIVKLLHNLLSSPIYYKRTETVNVSELTTAARNLIEQVNLVLEGKEEELNIEESNNYFIVKDVFEKEIKENRCHFKLEDSVLKQVENSQYIGLVIPMILDTNEKSIVSSLGNLASEIRFSNNYNFESSKKAGLPLTEDGFLFEGQQLARLLLQTIGYMSNCYSIREDEENINDLIEIENRLNLATSHLEMFINQIENIREFHPYYSFENLVFE